MARVRHPDLFGVDHVEAQDLQPGDTITITRHLDGAPRTLHRAEVDATAHNGDTVTITAHTAADALDPHTVTVPWNHPVIIHDT